MKTLILGLAATFAFLALTDDANAQLIRRRRSGGCSSGNCNASLSGCAPGSACAAGNANAALAVVAAPVEPVTVVAPSVSRSSASATVRSRQAIAPFANARATAAARRADRLNARGNTIRVRSSSRVRLSSHDFRGAAEAALANNSIEVAQAEIR